MPSNIELKAQLHDLAAAREVALRVATAPPTLQQQSDTYFCCQHGRLKLREIEGESAQLVGYAREDAARARPSEYRVVPVNDAQGLKQVLTAALGIHAIVRKRREIFLYHNVRIHLDQVERLGEFIEFEAVLSDDLPSDLAHKRLGELQQAFVISPTDFLAYSYGDLIGKGS